MKPIKDIKNEAAANIFFSAYTKAQKLINQIEKLIYSKICENPKTTFVEYALEEGPETPCIRIALAEIRMEGYKVAVFQKTSDGKLILRVSW